LEVPIISEKPQKQKTFEQNVPFKNLKSGKVVASFRLFNNVPRTNMRGFPGFSQISGTEHFFAVNIAAPKSSPPPNHGRLKNSHIESFLEQ